jgi:methyl-accepting chemotaxis protein
MAEQLSATVQEMSGTATEIMASVGQIDKGAQQQAAATQQTSAALTEVEKSAKLAQSNAKAAQQQVQHVEAALKGSRQLIDALVTGVSKGLREARESLAQIGELEGVSRNIEKNVDGIAIVAVQTSMLAVSGAVEAARAGDSGRGFAVVSKDIRSLAREAAESADRVKDTVRGVVDQIRMVRGDIEQIIIAAELEVEKNRSIAGLFDKAASDVRALHDLNGIIAQGAEAILLSSSQAASGAQQIASAAEEAGSAARQAATAATEQATGVEDLAAAVEEIASLAEEMNSARG